MLLGFRVTVQGL